MSTANAVVLASLDFNLPSTPPSSPQPSITALPHSHITSATTSTSPNDDDGHDVDTNTPPPTRLPSDATTTATAVSSFPSRAPSSSSASPKVEPDTTVGSESEVTRKSREKALVRKLDFCLFPCLVGMCLFQAVDRSIIGIAKIDHITDDLSITQSQFNTALSILQVGYCLFQIPSNLIIVHPKVHPGIYLSITCLAWSVSSLSHAFVQNYGQLLTVRFLLGMFDAPYFVGSTYILTCWYTRKEMAMRMGLMLVCLIFTLTFFAPAAAGIMKGLQGSHGWRGWRWIYVIFGSTGGIVAVWGLVMLPGSLTQPSGEKRTRVWWLNEDQYELAWQRMEEDSVGVQQVEKNRIWIGLREAVKDLRTWVFVVMMLSRKSFDGLWLYDLQIVQSLGLLDGSGLSPQTSTLLLVVGPAAVAGIVTLGAAYSSDRHSERSWHIIVPLLFALVGLVVCAITLDSAMRYVMMFLWEAGALAGIASVWAWVSSTIQETPEKRAVAIAVVNVVGGLGAIYGPFLFRGQDAPGYRLAFGVLAGFVVLDICCVFVMRRLLRKANRVLKEQAESEDKVSQERLYIL